MRAWLDLNCDAGESLGNWIHGADDELLPLVSTTSLACGFHAGDPVTMRRSVAAAVAADTAVGAHPGLPDLLGFGRRSMAVSPEDLQAGVTYQCGALEAFLRPHGARLTHVKPHGVLYPMLNAQEDLARAAVEATRLAMDQPVIFWPADPEPGAFVRVARAEGVRVVGEFYPDSRYGPDGQTVVERSRSAVGADEAEAALRLFLEEGRVRTVDGDLLEIEADSLCVHGDGPTAVPIATRCLSVMEDMGVRLRSAAEALAEAGR